MKADSVNLLENFLAQSNGTQYIIPVYQRNYTWNKNDQVSKLMDDVYDLLKDKNKKHFIGSIVYSYQVALNAVERSVIDGQQRLTTIFLILYAMKHLSDKSDNKGFSEMIKNRYLENSYGDQKYKLRLKPMVSDDEVYKLIATEQVDEFNKVESKSKVKDNYLYIINRLKDYMDKGYSLMDFHDALNRIYIVYIQLDGPDNPQAIFESLNSTGQKLTASDLIRNYVLMNKTNDVQELYYMNYWKKYEEIINSSKKLETFFRFYLASKTYQFCNKDNVYQEFKEYWNNLILKGNNENSIFEDIKRSINNYHKLYISDDKDDVLGESLNTFRRLNYETHAPFMLGLFELYDDKKITDVQLKESIDIANNYFVRRMLAGKDMNDISRTFPTILKNIINYAEKNGYTHFVNIVKTELIFKNINNSAAMPTDNEIKRYIKNVNFYVMKYCKWFLEKIEMHNNRVPIDFTKLNIEHIMPRKRANEWELMTSEYSDEDYAEMVNKLGNLTLIASVDNSKIKNNNFNDKKEIIKESSHIKMNEDILSLDKWSIDNIESRTDSMIKVLLNIFPYSKSEFMVDDEENKIFIFDDDNNVIASGYLYNDKKVVLFKGSEVKLDVDTTDYIETKRQECLEDGFIDIENNKYVLKEQYILNSPSAAANFILGGDRNGNQIWKNHAKIKIADL